MEDPWGSPWTNDSPPKIDLPAPPPHAHFTADHSGSSQRVSPAHTPWNEDDDAWGGWAEAGKDSSPRWGRSPGLRPIGGSPAGSRLPSPAMDSWGRTPTFDMGRARKDDNGDSAISLGEGLQPIIGRVATRTPSPVRSLKENVADIWQQPGPALSHRSISPLPSEDEGRPGSPDGAPRPAMQHETRPRPLRQPSNKVSELVEMFDDMAKSTQSASPVDPMMRNDSDDAISFQDAILDVGANGLEKSEEKLQLEDGAESESEAESGLEKELDQEAREPNLESERIPEVTSNNAPAEENDIRREEIEDTPTAINQLQTESDSWSDFESPTQGPPKDETPAPQLEVSKEQPVVVEPATEPEVPEESTAVRPKPPSVPFSVDLTKLDDLFPSVETSFSAPEPVPDVIIDDTFASISERKAWYLMSRPGSMRKHNMGDDDNYVRVGWGNSHVRERSIGIVRRWMEEDSITGRVVLGRRGGASGAKIFNWDSAAPATEISISELLARKNHSRHTSVASKGTIASPTAATFGWGSEPVPSPTSAAPPSVPRTSNVSESTSATEASPVEATKTSIEAIRPPPLASPPKPRIIEEPPSPIKPIPLKPTNRPISITQPLPFPSSPTITEPQSPIHPPSLLPTNRPVSISQAPTSPLAQPPTNAGWGEDEEDDDDWGDMVSSPTIETNGGFSSMDAIVDSNPPSEEHTSKPSIAAQSPVNDAFKDISDMETMSNGRSSMEALSVPSQGLAPNGSQPQTSSWKLPSLNGVKSNHSRSTTLHTSVLPAKNTTLGHLRSTTVDLGASRLPLDGSAPANLTPNQANPSAKIADMTNTWDSWGLGLLDDSNKPVKPSDDTLFVSQALQTPFTSVDALKDKTSSKKPRPMSLPVPPRPQTVVESPKDDEMVANILRDIPDLSYMLR
ncbi:hypothetical protein FHETE_8950 [Fusarium heterosporum]|uniref:Uncharacterized protein n=1 Tax=Fusarium heterosporum TaxID=42747 RepID=A0A8H5WJH2_FUSHE|nr:hypothetical protein FHETE_8950 [Fusarium heterosporum]